MSESDVNDEPLEEGAEALEEQGTPLPPKERVKEPDPEPPGAPEWVVTFTDMISLLVTFFVLLMTYLVFRYHNHWNIRRALYTGTAASLALLSKGMLKGEQLTAFIQRSAEMIA